VVSHVAAVRSVAGWILFCFVKGGGGGGGGGEGELFGDVGCGNLWGMYGVWYGWERESLFGVFGGSLYLFCLEGLLLGEDLVSCLHVVPRLVNTTSTYTSLLPPSQGAPHLSHNLHQLSDHLLHTFQNQCARPPTPIANPHTAQPPLLLPQHPQHRRHNPRPTAPKRMP